METAQAIDRWVMGLAANADIFPEAVDLIDMDRAELYKARLMGVPAVAMRGKEEVEKLRADRAEAQKRQQAVAEATAAGDAAKSVGEGAEASGIDPAEVLQLAGGTDSG